MTDAPVGQRDWRLIWQDEFTGPEIDRASWTHQVFPGVDSGNNEFQHYTDRPENSFIEDGKLVIRAQRESYRDHEFTSARLTTAKKFSFTYGRVEARLRLPSTKGAWPALWMMPEDAEYGGWPLSGEIDIVEAVNKADKVHGTIHFGNPGHVYQGASFQKPLEGGGVVDFSEDFHTFAIEWDPGEIRWYVDGEHFGTQAKWATPGKPFPAPFDRDFHLIANLAVGGNWPGPPDGTSVFPQRFEIDWIRVYQSGNKGPELAVLSPASSETPLPAGSIKVSVAATDPDGSVAYVELLDGGDVLARSTVPPFDLETGPLPDGCYGLTMVAVDDGGMRARRELNVRLGEGCPRRPWGEYPASLPGRIEAEAFDRGAPGEAYVDADPTNNGGELRPRDGVDLEQTPDGGIYLGWTERGEWVSYAISPTASSSRYKLRARVASASGAGGRFSVRSGVTAPVEVIVPPTGGWTEFIEIEGGPIEIVPGETQLLLSIDQGEFNIDWIELVSEGGAE
ncbi:MAG: family 16 glycosylhydrolase [Candidatus Sumerlaeia bacterium]|nr:family 16 glycosylhydrolase [Candidatus Sumerlaeia bacterium]